MMSDVKFSLLNNLIGLFCKINLNFWPALLLVKSGTDAKLSVVGK